MDSDIPRPDAPLIPPPPPAYAPPPAPEAASPARRRNTGARIGVAVGVLALMGIAASLAVALTGSGAGASSPEDAVRQFTAAVSDEDIVAAVALMPPSEVGSAHELYDLVIKVLQKNDALSSKGNPAAGIDLDVRDLELETQSLHEDVGKVFLRAGNFGVDVRADELDPKLRSQGDGVDLEDVHESITVDDIEAGLQSADFGFGDSEATHIDGNDISGVFLMTVREQGRWYVSPSYTIAEYAREALGLPAADFTASRSHRAPGADSPTAVLDSYAAAISAFDSDSVIEALTSGSSAQPQVQGAIAPGEFGVFADYIPAFTTLSEQFGAGVAPSGDLDDFRAQLAEQLRDVDFDIDVALDSAETRIGDDRVKVVVTGGTLEAHVDGTVLDERVTSDVAVRIHDRTCASVTATITSNATGTTSVDEDQCADDVLPGTDFDGFFIVTVKRDGKWYFSVTETLVEYARLALQYELAR
jgi:hypothetical protein